LNDSRNISLKFSRERPIKQDHMDLRIGQLNPPPSPATPRKAVGSSPSGAQFSLPRADSAEIGIPAEPPVDALREVDRAAARAEELWRDQRELHFEMDEDSGRVVVQVRDLDGRLIRTIPPSEALDILSGRPL
jgi:FlaG protein